jgi:transposase
VRAVRQAKGLLMAGDGVANSSIAEALHVSRSTVLQWRSHFESGGVRGHEKVPVFGHEKSPPLTEASTKEASTNPSLL